jgi:hypothetical protein
MSVSCVPEKVKIRLWGQAAGRCEYEGCNKPLWLDEVTKAQFNSAYVAHIIADKPGGPRGDGQLSEKLKDNISNLMLLCDVHHRLVDKEEVESYPVERLRYMKRIHEERIELLSSLQTEKQSEVLCYGARIGEHHAQLSFERLCNAMIPQRYPARSRAIELSLTNTSFRDNESEYWQIEREHLRREFAEHVRPRLISGEIAHFSVFALAPQPLLFELGRLLSDIPAADVYQLHREPPDWRWQADRKGFDYIIMEPESQHDVVALNLSLSATIDNSRIASVLGTSTSVWTLTIRQPNNDFLKGSGQLALFRRRCRELLNRMKAVHGEGVTIHVFPAVPVSIAVEIGRVWMPKADLPLRLYDQNRKRGGFVFAFDIGNAANNLGDTQWQLE